ncbi:hypothetical protein RSAG8_12177, partial [Rhizoctonia solani AG-8 WAC10335]
MQTPYNEPLSDAFGLNEYGEYPGLPLAKPLVELEMTRLSADIRRKPSWWTKCRDEDVLIKWRIEALAQANLMKEPHVDYVLKELDGYANLRDEASGAEVSCYDRIWQSDKLVSASLKERLVTGAKKLENVPEAEKDWHPRSNKQVLDLTPKEQVLDLVHPSLYPIVYGRTLSYPEDSESRDPSTLAARLKPPQSETGSPYSSETTEDYFVSKRFQWLPTDFKVSEDGKSVKSESYINNLHPIEHAELHKAVEDLMAAYTPLFERVLTDSIPENGVIPERTLGHYVYDDDGYSGAPKRKDYSNNAEYNKGYREWEQNRSIVTPGIKGDGYEPGKLEKREIKYTLGGRTIQVIVKFANIHLSPENPEYPGGSWHVEGMKNEAIAVSGIYYYDEENITESRLAFRTAVAPPEDYEQSDDRGCRDDPCVNEFGSVITCQDRCIAFPNTYQHRVSPFELADKSKPGHRKIVALFLVDPVIRRPSTTTVPPQQAEWRASGISANPVLKAAFDKLSPEIIDHIGSMVEGTMTREEAEAYRLELMDERKAFVQKNDEAFFMVPFDMCEH